MLRRALLAAPAAMAAARMRQAGKVETVFKSPGPQPNGLQATAEGLWIMDQGNNNVYLVNFADGKVIRSFVTDADRASGITHDGQALWLASTYSRELIRADAMTGRTLAKYFTPGAGVIYKMAGDPAAPSRPLAHTGGRAPAPPRPGALPPSQASGTRAHGMEWGDAKRRV